MSKLPYLLIDKVRKGINLALPGHALQIIGVGTLEAKVKWRQGGGEKSGDNPANREDACMVQKRCV